MLPTEVRGAPSLERFRVKWDGALSNLIRVGKLEMSLLIEGELDLMTSQVASNPDYSIIQVLPGILKHPNFKTLPFSMSILFYFCARFALEIKDMEPAKDQHNENTVRT